MCNVLCFLAEGRGHCGAGAPLAAFPWQVGRCFHCRCEQQKVIVVKFNQNHICFSSRLLDDLEGFASLHPSNHSAPLWLDVNWSRDAADVPLSPYLGCAARVLHRPAVFLSSVLSRLFTLDESRRRNCHLSFFHFAVDGSDTGSCIIRPMCSSVRD